MMPRLPCGGVQVAVLEFDADAATVPWLYGWYFRNVLPRIMGSCSRAINAREA